MNHKLLKEFVVKLIYIFSAIVYSLDINENYISHKNVIKLLFVRII